MVHAPRPQRWIWHRVSVSFETPPHSQFQPILPEESALTSSAPSHTLAGLIPKRPCVHPGSLAAGPETSICASLWSGSTSRCCPFPTSSQGAPAVFAGLWILCAWNHSAFGPFLTALQSPAYDSLIPLWEGSPFISSFYILL